MFCYRCGYDPCLYASESCAVAPQPLTVRDWAWRVLYDATVERVGHIDAARLLRQAMTALRV